MSEIVLMADPRVTAIPVRECGEPLVDLRESAVVRLDERKRDATGAFALVRSGVARRLTRAARLLPSGVALVLVEGFRLPVAQRDLFDAYRTYLATVHPELGTQQLHLLASRYLAPPEVAPHTAGAAVDMTLLGMDGTELDLGTAVNATPEESDGACFTDSPLVTGAARANRDLLARVLLAAGFVNYPTEWWHWSYGDRYWALLTGAAAAIYGPLER